ncbi:hypothetical protein BC940DRAFT_288705, partial [Gongronella butleri]
MQPSFLSFLLFLLFWSSGACPKASFGFALRIDSDPSDVGEKGQPMSTLNQKGQGPHALFCLVFFFSQRWLFIVAL